MGRELQVWKFGGASLADAAAVRHAVEIVRSHRAEPTVVVASAMAGITDALLAVVEQAGLGSDRTVPPLIARLRSRHTETARALLPAGRGRTAPRPGGWLLMAGLTTGPAQGYAPLRYAAVHMVTVAQMVAAPRCGRGGRGFKSRRSHHAPAGAPVQPPARAGVGVTLRCATLAVSPVGQPLQVGHAPGAG